MDQSKLTARVANLLLKLSSKKLTAKLLDQKRMKNPLRMMKLWFASDVMEQKSTKKAFLADDAMDQETLTANSLMI